MILLIGGEKGGTGKSTLATNLAVWLARAQKDVLLLDADRQSTAAFWATERGSQDDLPPVHCVQRYGNLLRPLQDLRGRYTEIVVDAGGRDSEELRSAMVVADKIYSPVRASQSDLWTVTHMDELLGLAKAMNPEVQGRLVLSMAPTNPRVNEAEDAAEMLTEVEHFQKSDAVVRDRKAFRDAMCAGRGVVELSDPKATAEVHELALEIYGG